MTARKRRPVIPETELRAPFDGPLGDEFPLVITPEQLAKICGLSPKTISFWIGKGRLDGAFRKRGKRNLIWRDRALDLIFNGEDWT